MYTLHYFPGNANLAPHMVLERVGAPYELALVDRAQNAQRSPDYLTLNPLGTIPVLVAPGPDGTPFALTEAAAICLYLAERHPTPGLQPQPGEPARAEFLRWLMFLTNTLQPTLLQYHYSERYTADPEGAPAVKQAAERRLGEQYGHVDRALGERTWLLGDGPTIADYFLGMVCRFGRMIGRPPRSYPALGRLLESLAARPEVRRACEQEGLRPPFLWTP